MEMSDFSIRVKNLPTDIEYDGREEILQGLLWCHFTSLLEARGDNQNEIVDITFGRVKMEDTE